MATQSWAVSATGGYLGHAQLSKSVYYQAQQIMRWVQFADLDEKFGANMGDTLLFDKIMDLDTRGGQLTETNPIPSTTHKIRQGTCIAYEWGNSLNFPEVLEHFAEIDPLDKFQRVITNDMAKVRDRMVKDEFANCKIKYTPTGTVSNPSATWATNGTVSATATRDLMAWDLREINEAMRSGVYGSTTIRPVPPFDGDGHYVFMGSVGAVRVLREDPDWKNAAYYGDPERLFNAEAGLFENFRVIEENHLLSRTLGTTSYKGEGFAFGEETVKLITVVPPELRRKIPLDYGRDRGIAWYSIEGVKLVWEYDSTNEIDNRIVHITSA